MRFLAGLTTLLAIVACRGMRDLSPKDDARAAGYLSQAHVDIAWLGAQSPSPDGKWSARADSVDWADRRVSVTDVATGQRIRVITIREADPGSGVSYGFAWTSDSRVLLMRGSGSFRGEVPRPFCLAYVVATDELLRADDCPVHADIAGAAGKR